MRGSSAGDTEKEAWRIDKRLPEENFHKP